MPAPDGMLTNVPPERRRTGKSQISLGSSRVSPTRDPSFDQTTATSRGVCRQGVGIAVLPRVVGDQIAGIRRMELPKSPPARNIWMGYHRDLRRLQRLRAFISTVSDPSRECDSKMSEPEAIKPAESPRCLPLGRNLLVPFHDSTHDQFHQAFDEVLPQSDIIGDVL
ncbi:LysR substrate-binding domain-containing protein [Sinorhizobium sp. 22678]|uniref:LysR substrate-binding domain-containing protein n=1 Tax=Sinorhizobium sp. 22678 TaxID=3453955 RepID=UPI003F83EF8E